MGTHVLINVTDEQELRVCRVTDGRFESLVHERQMVNPHAVGNIYKAKVSNVEPSLDAAFVELDGTKNGFIHIDDVIHDKGPKARIEDVLKKGQEILVQITKEPIRDKGACVTMYLRLAGRYLVLMSDSDKNGVSKKIEDAATRRRLKKLLAGFPIPEGFGLILRTAAAERTDEEIKLDFDFLSRVWSEIKQRADRMSGSLCLFRKKMPSCVRCVIYQATISKGSSLIVKTSMTKRVLLLMYSCRNWPGKSNCTVMRFRCLPTTVSMNASRRPTTVGFICRLVVIS